MRDFIIKALAAMTAPRRKTVAAGTPAYAGVYTGGSYDSYKRKKEPSHAELMRELRNTAYTCANVNASTCAAYKPKLYVTTAPGQPAPKCLTKRITDERVRQALQRYKSVDVQEVTAHPLITLLHKANPVHSGFDLLELTTLYQECTGLAYWFVDIDSLNTPDALWPLIPSLMRPVREKGSENLVDYYEYTVGTDRIKLDPEQVIVFRYPDMMNPYYGGTGPVRGAIDNVHLDSTFLAFKQSIWDNAGLPSAVISPKDGISPTERTRMEEDWARKFRRGGQGQVLVADDAIEVKLLEPRLGDYATLAEQRATKETIANAHGVPLSFLTTDTNLANLEAAERQHATLAIRPRLIRRDNTINEQLVPMFDPTGRLFVQSDDPVLASLDFVLRQQAHELGFGVRTINEVRIDRGLDPVAWGDEPWLPLTQAQTSFDRRHASIYAPQVGRNKPEQPGEQQT